MTLSDICLFITSFLALVGLANTCTYAEVKEPISFTVGDTSFSTFFYLGDSFRYEATKFSVSQTGTYNLTTDTELPTGTPWDGWLELYNPTFDPSNYDQFQGYLADNDNEDSNPGICAGNTGSATCSQIITELEADTTYVLLQTSNYHDGEGLPFSGPYEASVDGPGAVTFFNSGFCRDDSGQPTPDSYFDLCGYTYDPNTSTGDDIIALCTDEIKCVGYEIQKAFSEISLLFSNGDLPAACPGTSSGREDIYLGVGCPVTVDNNTLADCYRKECPNPSQTSGTVSCGGDPHFSTWNDDHFNFNGQCDLTFVSSKSFAKEQGLDIHVRTVLESFYSIVAAVAVKVGPKIFEFNHETVGAPKYFVDGKQLAGLPYEDDQFKATTHNVHNEDHNRLVQIINIELAGGQASLHITVMDQWVHLNVKATNILDSKGITGSFPNGKMLARDGSTDLSHDRNAYGSEWQVQEDEPKLFHSIPEGHPQAPQATCKMPLEDAHQYLRTRDSELYNMAIQACKQEGLTGLDLEDCIFDVSVMNNPKIAAAWWAAEKAEE